MTRRALPIAWSLPIAALALACAGCGAPRDRFAGLPREQIDFVFGPWPNGMRMPPEERYRPDLALVALLDTGELFLRLPRGARGQAWCHITVPGRKPLLLWGDVDARITSNVRFHVLTEPISHGGAWSIRRWQPPEAEGGPTVGKDLPAWYVSRFKHKQSDDPLFLHIVGARKGQIFLNRHNVGRFWNIGPQQYYYLPDCWLAEDNELLIFEEGGNIPSRSRLAWRPRGPYRE